MIHGVYGGWENESQAGPGSGNSEWVATYAQSLDSPSRILRFEYEPLQLFCGRKSRQAIRNCALKLLRALAARRKNQSQVCVLHRCHAVKRIYTINLTKSIF